MSAITPAQQAPDSNALLVQLCVKILSAVAPEGMTTKELAGALDKEVVDTPGFEGISSSILSSKLNAIFRRCHGEASTPSRSQLAELPLTRNQSVEVPRRLVYRYTPPTEAGSDVPEAPATPVEDNSSSDEAVEQSEPLTPKEDSTNGRHSYGPVTKKRRVSASPAKESAYPANPGTPPETFASSKSDNVKAEDEGGKTAASKLPSLSAASDTPDQVAAAPGAAKERRSRFTTGKSMGLNLYYDALGLDAMSAALNLKQSKIINNSHTGNGFKTEDEPSADLDWSDFPSPELLGLHELDGFVC